MLGLMLSRTRPAPLPRRSCGWGVCGRACIKIRAEPPSKGPEFASKAFLDLGTQGGSRTCSPLQHPRPPRPPSSRDLPPIGRIYWPGQARIQKNKSLEIRDFAIQPKTSSSSLSPILSPIPPRPHRVRAVRRRRPQDRRELPLPVHWWVLNAMRSWRATIACASLSPRAFSTLPTCACAWAGSRLAPAPTSSAAPTAHRRFVAVVQARRASARAASPCTSRVRRPAFAKHLWPDLPPSQAC